MLKIGQNVYWEFKRETGEIECGAYEPTKNFRKTVSHLRSGDVIRVYGGIGEHSTFNVEKFQVIELNDIETILDIEKLESIFKELKEAQYEKILLNIDFADGDEDLVLDEEIGIGKTNFTLRKKLPFGINITETSKVLNEYSGESIENISVIEDIGYIKLNIDEKESKIFHDGKISIENNANKEDAKKSLVKILPLIRRTV